MWPGVPFPTWKISLHVLFVASGVFLLYCLQVFLLLLPRLLQVWLWSSKLSSRTSETAPSAHPGTQVSLLITLLPALDKVKLGT